MRKSKVIAIIQARMGSTRLPGKVLKKVLDKPLVGFVIDRVSQAANVDGLVVATTKLSEDDLIEAYCNQRGVPVFRGAVDDVLERFQGAAHFAGADVIVRITADCPLIDPDIIDLLVRQFVDEHPRWDYVSNTLERTFPRGLDVEVFSRRALEKAATSGKLPEEREHVTPYIYRHPEIFALQSVTNTSDQSEYRWTVDTAEDFELVKRLIESQSPKNLRFSHHDLIAAMEKNPKWKKINADVQQREIS